jgi:hypothetical protein
MPDFRTALPDHWHGPALAVLVGLAAYAGARASRRSAAAEITQLSSTVDEIAADVRRVDYWTVYRQAQSDLLRDEE